MTYADFYMKSGLIDLTKPVSKITPQSAMFNRINTFKGEYLLKPKFGIDYIAFFENRIPVEILIAQIEESLKNSKFFNLLGVSYTLIERTLTVIIKYSEITNGTASDQQIEQQITFDFEARSGDRFIVAGGAIG